MPIDPALIREVWSHLPWWVPWGNLLLLTVVSLGAGTLGTAAILALSLPSRKLVANVSWGEHARLLTPGRLALVIALLATPMLMSLGPLVFFGPLSGLSPQHGAGLLFILTVVASIVTAGLFASRLTGRSTSVVLWCKHCVAQSLFMYAAVIGPLIACVFVPLRVDGTLAVALVGMWLLTQLVVRYAHLILRWLRLMRPADADLQRRVDAVFEEVGATRVPAWIVENVSANAFALRQADMLLFTPRLLDTLSEQQVRAIVAHEAGHFLQAKSRTSSLLMSTALFGLPAGLAVAADFGRIGGITFGVLFVVLILSLSKLLQKRSRDLERNADATAHAHVDAETYVQALSALHHANLIPASQSGEKGTHPDLAERARAAGVEPTAAAAPPSPMPALLKTMAILVLFTAPAYVMEEGLLHETYLPRIRREHTGHLPALALSAGRFPWVLADLAKQREAKGDSTPYFSFTLLAAQLCFDDPHALKHLKKVMQGAPLPDTARPRPLR